MILDICFDNEPPRQIQNVRTFTIYPKSEMGAVPELIIHFKAPEHRSEYIDLERITSCTVTND